MLYEAIKRKRIIIRVDELIYLCVMFNMMCKRFVFIVGMFLVISACGWRANFKLHLIFDNVEGLTDKSEVKLHGLTIGRITEFQLMGDKVLVTALINDPIQITRGSQFFIQSSSVFGPIFIEVHPNKLSKDFILSGDTIQGTMPGSLFEDSTTFKLDSQTIEMIKPLVDTLAHSIRDLHTAIRNER